MNNSINVFFIFLFSFVFPIFLQIVICRNTRGKLGLILPALSLVISLIYLANITSIGNKLLAFFTSLFVVNIRTIILYAIYRSFLKAYQRQSEIEKMKLQDY